MNRTVTREFGAMSFNKKTMRERLPYPIYLKWKNAVRNQEHLDKETADAIAHAMKEWSLEKGATHYCHWFQPLNGSTAKKHDAFLDRSERNEPIYRFSGKELVKGESDGSSFPSGGIRSTFEARGYTYWDPSSNSFIIDRILYIPTIFVSYRGEKLDTKAPLIESMNLLSEKAANVVNLFEKSTYTYRMKPKLGVEQEFFLIDEEMYQKRTDLKSCGRTLFGANPPKDQEMDDHYLGSIPERVMDFYEDLNQRLWDLGIYAKTEHNEVAPCQFEVAVLFENVNISVDYNQLVMSLLKDVAKKHGLVCLLHEKPFAGNNGSGKHNNYSLGTNWGLNVFDPGAEPAKNIIFLLFASAVIEAVDTYAPLLRVASSGPSNDFRLGGLEAPPAIISIYLGDAIESALYEAAGLENEGANPSSGEITISALGTMKTDSSDRNRTSPFAFTGNRFEFRMVGSSVSCANTNTVINTILADSLGRMYERLTAVEEREYETVVRDIVREVLTDHGRILYGKDNYSEVWVQEAHDRGLTNFPTYLDAIASFKDDQVVQVFKRHGIFSDVELRALYEIALESVINYHTLEIRALLSMLSKDIEPAVLAELTDLTNLLIHLENGGVERKRDKINSMLEELYQLQDELEETYHNSLEMEGVERAYYLQEEAKGLMDEIRCIVDELEMTISRKNWSIPTYEDIFTALE